MEYDIEGLISGVFGLAISVFACFRIDIKIDMRQVIMVSYIIVFYYCFYGGLNLLDW